MLTNGDNKTILIVEDDLSTRLMLQHYLKKAYNIVTCDNEIVLFEKLNNIKIDLIIMDISLGGIKDGLQITAEIKNDTRFKALPIICLTAHGLQEDEENAYNAGIDLYLKKPVSIERIKEVIDALV